MVGSVVAWFQSLHKQRLLPTWYALCKAIESQFGPSRFDSPRVRLFKLSQTTTATAFYTDFTVLVNRVEGLTEDAIVDCFISGLKPTLRRDVLVHGPTTLIRAAELAKLFDDSDTSVTFGNRSSNRSWSNSPHAPKAISVPPRSASTGSFPVTSAGVASTPLSVSTTPTSSVPAFKRLSAAELRARRERGLCYYCDDKYSATHKCKPTFCLLLGPEEISEVIQGHVIDDQEGAPSEDIAPELASLTPEISLQALEGEFHPRTLRLIGFYKRESLKILVDSGSTLNFIKGSVARRLKLRLIPVTPFRVVTGNGSALICSHKCARFAFTIQGVDITADFFILEISGMDMILGVQWLAQLGNVISNYSQMTMSFFHHNRQVTLQGNSRIEVTQLHSKDFCKLLDSSASAGFYTLQRLDEHHTPAMATLPPLLQTVLDQYQEIFHEPTQLPPKRPIDHRITLLPNAKPVNVRPYRYPHFQKTEMEKLVAEMQSTGVIRDSQSAFSSPVLLVKKKDGSWRFCVDYRSLNDVTV